MLNLNVLGLFFSNKTPRNAEDLNEKYTLLLPHYNLNKLFNSRVISFF